MREVCPPPDKQIEHYAHEVCKILALRHDRDDYVKPEVIGGLAAFIKLAARIKAKQLAKG